MPSRDNPCRECTTRSAFCRLNCEKWDEYVEKRDADYIRPERKAESDYIGHVVDRMEICRKRTRRKGKHR